MSSVGEAEIQVRENPEGIHLILEGRLDSRTTGKIWKEANRALGDTPPRGIVVEASGVSYCDISGIGFLVELRRRQEESGGSFEIRGLREDFHKLLEMFPAGNFRRVAEQERSQAGFVEKIGRATVEILEDLREQIIFLGHLMVGITLVLFRRQKIRWNDTMGVIEAAGVNALPITCLVGFTMGVVIAFQAGMALKRFAAEVYVADSVVISMLREIGPFFTAIVLAGRTGSAFAAELGTMKVNEEIDALKTMGLDPVPFLAVPRVIAGVIVTPLLTIFANVAGIVGGGLVYLTFGFSVSNYFQRIQLRGDMGDLASGLIKAVIFGIVIASVGCLQGLRTGKGARAVGESTTKSVVAGIVLVVILDGVFGVAFYYLGI